MGTYVNSNLIQCLSPNCCNNTIFVVLQDEVKAGEPIEFVSQDAATGKITAKKLTDATKIIGAVIEDGKVNEVVPAINRGDLRVEALVMPDGILRKDLAVDATNAPHLNLVRGETV